MKASIERQKWEYKFMKRVNKQMFFLNPWKQVNRVISKFIKFQAESQSRRQWGDKGSCHTPVSGQDGGH